MGGCRLEKGRRQVAPDMFIVRGAVTHAVHRSSRRSTRKTTASCYPGRGTAILLCSGLGEYFSRSCSL